MTKQPHHHPALCPYCQHILSGSELAKLMRAIHSEKRAEASRINGAKGGRKLTPPSPDDPNHQAWLAEMRAKPELLKKYKAYQEIKGRLVSPAAGGKLVDQ